MLTVDFQCQKSGYPQPNASMAIRLELPPKRDFRRCVSVMLMDEDIPAAHDVRELTYLT